MASHPQSLTPAKAHTDVSLSSLPTELIEHIATHLDLFAFRALRLTHSSCRTQTLHIFKHRFISTHTIQWTQSSLQQLVDIATHNDLGDSLQRLIINATPYYSVQLWQMRRRSSDAGHFTPVTDDEDGSRLVRRLNSENEQLAEQAHEVATWFNETRFDVKCLTTVFSRLASLESITFAYTGMAPRFQKFGRRYCESSQHEMSRPFVSTMLAVATSGVVVGRIELQQGKEYGAVGIGRLESLAPSLLRLSHALSTLSTLQFNLRDWRTPDSGFEPLHHRVPFVVRFLAKCTSVKVLELSCYSDLESDLFGEMARTCHFEKLETCRLELFRLQRASDLLSFLGPSSGSLRELKLHSALLADEEKSWHGLLRDMAESTVCLACLVVLEVKYLYTPRGSRLVFLDERYMSFSLRVSGPDWREELRGEKYNYHESSSVPSWEMGAALYPFEC
jgi:hypothetical protein